MSFDELSLSAEQGPHEVTVGLDDFRFRDIESLWTELFGMANQTTYEEKDRGILILEDSPDPIVIPSANSHSSLQ